MSAPTINPAAEINGLHQDICEHARKSIAAAIRIGELLTQQKGQLRHGEWLPWLKASVRFSQQTASNYIRVYREREKLPSVGSLSLTEAYRLLSPVVDDLGELAALASDFPECVPNNGEFLFARWGVSLVYVVPSSTAGFFFVAAVGANHVDGTSKPVRGDFVPAVLDSLGIKLLALRPRRSKTEARWRWNHFLLDSPEDHSRLMDTAKKEISEIYECALLWFPRQNSFPAQENVT